MIKRLLFEILCNRLTGWLVLLLFGNNVPDLRWKGFRFFVGKGNVRYRQVASLFWGFYESAEIRMIEKYLKSDRDVLELGGSIGVVSSHIASKLAPGKRLITVEANPGLIALIEENTQRHKTAESKVVVANCAVSAEFDTVALRITGNNTETRVARDGDNAALVQVKGRTFGDLVSAYDLVDFVLVCDIEGSEIEILLNERENLVRCGHMIIELHETEYRNIRYDVPGLVKLIQEMHHFRIVEQHGPVCYFERLAESKQIR